MNNNFSKYILEHGGEIKKLTLPYEMSEGVGVCNPSVFIDNGKILCNIRKVNYFLHLSLSNHWNSAFGPTNYHHRDDDVNLRTENYMCELDDDLNIIEGSIKKVNYKEYEPKWNFVGEEDVRIVKWEDRLYLTGCRRDTENTGISRMELSEVDSDMNEISRARIPAPGDNNSYCEKNWMAIIDKPYQYVKWCNPLEIVEYDTKTKTTKDILIKEQTLDSIDVLCDLRGSSQVINVDNYYIAIVHEVNLWHNRYAERSAKYFTRFIVWDENWNTVKLSQRFWFMNFPIEFTNGLAYDGHDFIIPFSVSDNAAYIARLNKTALFQFIGITNDIVSLTKINTDSGIYEYIQDIFDPYKAYYVGIEYFEEKQYASAFAFFIQAAELATSNKDEYKRVGYDAFYMAQKCIELVGGRQHKLLAQYNILIQWDPDRYEAYYEMSRIYYGAAENKNDYHTALGYISIAMNKLDSAKPIIGLNINEKYMTDRVRMQYAICCYRATKDYEAVPLLKDLIANGHDIVKNQILSLNLNL